jgi:hypothetical protein
LVWWVIWGAIGFGLISIQAWMPAGGFAADFPPVVRYIPFVPLGLSVVVRWLVLPRIQVAATALSAFIVGLALAEGSGILGILLGQETRQSMVLLALLGIAQFAPVWASRFGPGSR